MADYTKFKAYWRSIGKPPIEIKTALSGAWKDLNIYNPEFDSVIWHYRIKDDPHWELRKKWVDSDFTLPIESKSANIDWGACPRPLWYPNHQYREMEQKPMTDEPKQYRQRCGLPGGIYEWNANPGADYPHNGWFQHENGFKRLTTFNNKLALRNEGDSPQDLIEITPYDGIAIDTPGWAEINKGERVRFNFAGVNSAGNPLVWSNGGTSWTCKTTISCYKFIPKGANE